MEERKMDNLDKQYTEPDDGGLILVLLVAVGIIGFVLGVAVGIAH